MNRKKKKEWVGFRDEIQSAVKAKCYDCMCQQKKTDCLLENCSLYPFRPWSKKDSWPRG